ncbi:MAG TPA: DEAD/DEAH box helicase, partial [Brevibacterium sp.]|nr:DEAD/DEAH box helicase [Brevibacterium sp.]
MHDSGLDEQGTGLDEHGGGLTGHGRGPNANDGNDRGPDEHGGRGHDDGGRGLSGREPDAALLAEATRLLGDLTGNPDAQLRDGQAEAIEALVAERRRALVVQRTGWGKSAVYFIAAKLMRRAGRGPSLIISPLLALMRDQVAAAARAGVVARTLNSANMTEWDEVRQDLAAGRVDVLLVSPERLTNPSFRDSVLPDL